MKKVIFIIIGAIVVIALVVVIIILRVDEDNWICTNGSWQKHGHPSSPQPTTTCQNK